MTPVLLRYAGARVAGQVAVVVALVSGLAGLAGGLEAAHQGFEVAVQVALLRTPALLVALMPVLVAIGAALAAAREGGGVGVRDHRLHGGEGEGGDAADGGPDGGGVVAVLLHPRPQPLEVPLVRHARRRRVGRVDARV